MVCRVLACLLAVSLVDAILDGTKLFKETRTHLKTPKARVAIPSSVLEQLKAHGDVENFMEQSLLSRSRRDSDSCGFNADVELEISPVSVTSVW